MITIDVPSVPTLLKCLPLVSLLLGNAGPGVADVWDPRAPVPGARASHSAVWTGTEMIVWGGGINGEFLDTGGRYDPATDTWQVTTLANAPSPRWFHAAVWTGSEMLIWGGRPNFDGNDNRDDGGRYDPVTDEWRPINTIGAPTRRSQCAAVWTGSEMIIWGGATDGGIELNDGAKYDPTTDTWTPISGDSGLDPRMEPASVWTGTEMIVFGGIKFTDGLLSFGDGARYNPATDSWTPLPAADGPGSRTGLTAVWTGSRMVVWGGYEVPTQVALNTGASYDPAADAWTALPARSAPQARFYHAAVWSGSEMIIWGGQTIGGEMLDTGARWNEASDTWTATTQIGAPGKRQFWRPDLGIWTGEGMIIAAGSDYPASLDSTFIYATNAPPSQTVYDVSGDFSPTTNPGRVWSYGHLETLDGPLTLLPFAKDFPAENGVPISGWQVADDLAPGVYRNMGGTTAVSVGGAFTAPPGAVWFYPGDDGSPRNFGVIRFQVPAGRSGQYRIETSVRSLYDGPLSRDSDFHVTRNGQELFGQFLSANSRTGFSNSLILAEGDTIDFVVGRGADGLVERSGLKLEATLSLVTNAPPLCNPPPAGIVAWWPAEGNPNDVIGTNRGTLLHDTGYATGQVGRGMAFRGDSDGVRIAASPALDVGTGSGLTLEAWINPADLSVRSPLVEWNHGGPGIVTWGVHFYILRPDEFALGAGNLYANLTDKDGNWHQITAPGGTVRAGAWQHVALTYDRATGVARLHCNGEMVSEQFLGIFIPQTSYDLYLGRRPAGDAILSYRGSMDEVSIYNRALSVPEIGAIARAGTSGKCRIPSTLDRLIAFVRGASVNPAPLLASLEAARASIRRGNLGAALNQLQAFQSKVRAQIAPSDPVLAIQFILPAQQILEELDPTGARREALDRAPAEPLRVLRLTAVSGGALRLEGRAEPGLLCGVERSTNLQDWEAAGDAVEVDDGRFEFSDPQPPTQPALFYRLRAP